MATVRIRVDQALSAAAKAAGKPHGRGAEQQLDHWARLGRQVELSPTVSQAEIARVLAGDIPYDGLNASEQAVVRVVWDKRIARDIDGLILGEHLRASGPPWYEADADGKVVRHDANRSVS